MEPSDAVLRGLLAAAPDALLAVDADGRIVYANDQAEQLFGWPKAELLSQRIESLVPERFRPHHSDLRAGYVHHPTTRPMAIGLDLRARRQDGSEFPAEISLSAVTDDVDGVMVLAAVRDIRDRIELEAQRQRAALEAQTERSQRLESLGQLAGGIAHDFNNLLGVILNYTTLVSRRVTDSTATADLDEIRDAAQRGAALVSQLLTFARRDIVRRESVDVNEAVTSVVSMLERTLGEHVELRLMLRDKPVHTMCDRSQLEQILVNLAINARDAMQYGGILMIAVHQDEATGQAVLTVTDTGHGMSSEVKARAFEPFFTTKPRGHGTGLGLATVYGIVKQSDGEIDIESTEGEGTSIEIRLPAADERAVTPAKTATSGGLDGHERVLLVEDEAPLRKGTARILEDAGYQVVTAGNGADALELFAARPIDFDIVVTDLAMPQMRGDEFVSELTRRGLTVPVVFMTGYDSGEAHLTGRVLAKPVKAEELLHAVREALDA